ENT
ncbi:phage regulatory protein Rha, partial [Haemophilus influenzae]